MLAKLIASSLDYNILPVKIRNINEPWLELVQPNDTRWVIVIEPVVGQNSLDLNSEILYFTNEENGVVCPQIYGAYTAEDIFYSAESDESRYRVVRLSVACLKDSLSLKHVKSSTKIALTNFLQYFSYMNHNFDIPYIILNTKSNASVVPMNGFSDIIREITEVWVNHYKSYPTILVAFSDNSDLSNEFPFSKKKKKKK